MTVVSNKLKVDADNFVSTDADNELVVGTDDKLYVPTPASSTREVIHVRDEKTSGTTGGNSSTGVNTRTLNTVVENSITGASLAK